ncbi:MAG: hypothetical protein RIR97_878 [Pseudomonadota bacterium]
MNFLWYWKTTMTPQDRLTTLLTTDSLGEGSFSRHFLNDVSLAQVTALIAELKQKHGRFLHVSPSEKTFWLHFERAKIHAEISLDTAGKITGLFFDTPVLTGALQDMVNMIASLPGETSVLVLSNGKTVAAHCPDRPLAVASTAKLAVLLALKQKIHENELAWGDVVTLDPAWKSLPSGQLQDWPDGSPLTIATLAHLMISISDNTATDALISIVGQAAMEAITPENMPFLTTREYFTLQSDKHAALRSNWETDDHKSRLDILDQISKEPLPLPDQISTVVTHGIDWRLSAHQICNLLDATADLPSVRINPGPADPKDWRDVAYKGGSDTGVLNLSTRLVGHDGSIHHVIATWNDKKALNETPFLAAYCGILSRLASASG